VDADLMDNLAQAKKYRFTLGEELAHKLIHIPPQSRLGPGLSSPGPRNPNRPRACPAAIHGILLGASPASTGPRNVSQACGRRAERTFSGLFVQPCTRPSRGPRRRLAGDNEVIPGETTVCLRRGCGLTPASLGAWFRPAGVLALPVGPRQPAPLALVNVHAPAAAKLLLLPCFKGFRLCFREICAYLHDPGTLAKPCAKGQTEKGATRVGPSLTSTSG
jgi:hypothetical protein